MTDRGRASGTAAGGDVFGLCTYCVRPAHRTCAGCGMPICEVHTSPDMPMFCVQCGRGRSHMPGPHLPDDDREAEIARDLEKVGD